MESRILNSEVQDYIKSHIDSDLKKLALSRNPFPDVPFPVILGQIAAASKAREKLPSWYQASGIFYPSKISMEQTSSEITAHYKSGLIDGSSVIDLTGGFGVDSYYFSKVFPEVVHCEQDVELSQIAAHNFDILAAANIRCVSGNGAEILQSMNRQFDWIYIDPSRRSDIKGKVFMLKDCLPDVPSNLGFYFGYSNNIMIKAAPLLDITAALKEVGHCYEVHVVAVRNEVKELLFLLREGFSGAHQVKTVNLLPNGNQEFSFCGVDASTVYGSPSKYLYEPNAAIMKSGGFGFLGKKFGLVKLHQHSHLFTSDNLIEFPGRRFKILEKLEYNKQTIKFLKSTDRANISVRNFPESVESLRKMTKINDGGDKYLFFTTGPDDRKLVLLCKKIN